MPSPADRLEELAQLLLLGGVHAGRRLVEREEPRVGGERARDLEAALVAVGEVLRELVAARADAHVVEQLPGAPVDRRLLRARGGVAQRWRPARPPSCARAGRSSRSRAPRGSRRGGCSGRCARCPARRCGRASRSTSARPSKRNCALVVAVEAGEHVEERGLARAVGADEAVDLAAADGEAHLRERREAAEALGDALDLEERGRGGRFRRRHRRARSRARASSPPRAAAPPAGTASSPPSPARRAACGSPRDR